MSPEPHRFPVRVYWEDTDAGGVVYHAAYLKFAERARSEMLADKGIDQWRLLKEKGIALAVRSMEIGFRAPARLGDSLEVVTNIDQTRNASVLLGQSIMRSGAVLTEMTMQIACVNRAGKAVRLPAIIRAALTGGAQ